MNDLNAAPRLPLTLGQQDFWEEFQAHPGQPVSVVAHATHLSGALDPEALATAITTMLHEADVLSLRFHADDPPTQSVDAARRPELRRLDLREHADPAAEARHLMQSDIDRPLDLCRSQLAATWLMRTGEQDWIWYLRGHHIFLDGFSMALIERRVAQLHAHLVTGADAGRTFGRLADYLAEEERYRASPQHGASRDHWRRYLATQAPAVLRKGSEDYPATPRSAEISLQHLVDPIRQVASGLEMGWPDLLIMLVALWLVQMPDEDDGQPGSDRLVWLPLMGRMGSVSARIPAMVLNIAPFRIAPNPQSALPDTLRDMVGELKTLRRHGRCRIEQIAADFGLSASQRFFFSPLINVMPFDTARFVGCDARREVLAAGPGDGFNVTISGSPHADGLRLILDADPSRTSGALFQSHVTGLPQFLDDCLTICAAEVSPRGPSPSR